MKGNKNGTSEVFAIWEYDSFERYKEIESKIRSDEIHVKEYMIGMKTWRKRICLQKYIVEMKMKS